MAQGAIKIKKSAGPKKQSVLGPKKGARTIAPKKAVLVKNAKMTKKHSAGLTAMTERTLGAKAGHLEMLKGGKKNKDGEKAKGGTKKFG
ncbi:MAG: hypothetical protein M1818_002720 [Claussenomyces sp. TS43310]|nr:MAG: hypothetical protein M1818_002720 [Claussenomyces sp. TS43310]